MKFTLRSLIPLLALAAVALAPASAPAGLFGGGEKARLLEKADAEYEAAKEAAKNYEVVRQMTELRKALGTYRQLSAQYPDYERQKVGDRIREVAFSIGSIEEKARRGEIMLPADELSAASQGTPAAASEAIDGKKPTEAESHAFRHPIPTLVRTAAPTNVPVAAAPVSDAAWMREALPNPLYDRRSSLLSDPAPSGDGPAPEPDDWPRLSRFANMIRAGKASDAVMELEDIVAAEGAKASIGMRVLFVRALLACNNYARAAEEAKSIPESAEFDPAVLSLRAAVAVAQDNLMEAQRQLDLLVTKYPDFSDAYVDFAYVTFLSDPRSREVRDTAVVYYKQALMRGAKRDPRLEEELGIRVE